MHVNRPLTNIAIAWLQKQSDFKATQIFPIVPSTKQGDVYFELNQSDWNRDEMKVRAPGDESAGGGYRVDATGNFFCLPYAYHHDIPDQVMANADDPLNLERQATQLVTQKALIKRERLFVAGYMAGGVWTGYDYDGVAASPSTNEVLQWNDATSTPIDDVEAAKLAVRKASGFKPNVLALGAPVVATLKNHPDIIARLDSGQTPGGAAVADEAKLAQIFGVERVVELGSVYETAAEAGTSSMDFIAGKVAGLFYAAPSPGIMMPSGGYTFSWTGWLGASADGFRIKRYRIEQKACTRVEIEMAFDMKKIATQCGAFFDSIVA